LWRAAHTPGATLNSPFPLKTETPAGNGPAGISPGGKRMTHVLLLLLLIVMIVEVKVKVIVKRR
jgi:hypothetical protein